MAQSATRGSRLTGTVTQDPRRLPLFILADASSSMAGPVRVGEGSKIGALNQSARALIAACRSFQRAEVAVAGIEFRQGQAMLSLPMTPAASAHWPEMTADGDTPLSAALRVVRNMIEDKTIVDGRAYRPVIVLISDGMPNEYDPWKDELDLLDKSERALKADRFAIAIGDADVSVLDRFVAPALRDNEAVGMRFDAGSEQQIVDAFKTITMSVVARGSSNNPDARAPQPRPNPNA
jgi:uncharacterized protein YegL